MRRIANRVIFAEFDDLVKNGQPKIYTEFPKPPCKTFSATLVFTAIYGKVIANPNIGYGCYTIQHADGWKRQFGLGWKAFKNIEPQNFEQQNTEYRNKGRIL